MPTTTIHFVRHGKVYNPNHLLYERLPGFHLSDRGMRMAQATGAYIAADPKLNTVAAVYSSPLERTRETAGAILDALNPVRAGRGEEPLELITDPRVIEAGNEFRGKRIGHGKGALCATATGSSCSTCGSRAGASRTGTSPNAWARSRTRRSASMPDGRSSSSARVADLELPAPAGDRPPRALDVPTQDRARVDHLDHLRQRYGQGDVHHICRPCGASRVSAACAGRTIHREDGCGLAREKVRMRRGPGLTAAA